MWRQTKTIEYTESMHLYSRLCLKVSVLHPPCQAYRSTLFLSVRTSFPYKWTRVSNSNPDTELFFKYFHTRKHMGCLFHSLDFSFSYHWDMDKITLMSQSMYSYCGNSLNLLMVFLTTQASCIIPHTHKSTSTKLKDTHTESKPYIAI